MAKFDFLSAESTALDAPSAVLEKLLKSFLDDSTGSRIKWEQRFGQNLLSRHLETLQGDFVHLIRNRRADDVDVSRRDMIISLFYGHINDTYYGVDSHLPSEYVKAYPTLLEHLSGNAIIPGGRVVDQEKIECHSLRTIRILPINKARLTQDASKNAPTWQRYIERHAEHGILLLQVNEGEARKALEGCLGRDRWTTDIGLWAHTCALLFESPAQQRNSATRRLDLIRKGEYLWNEYVRYLTQLIHKAKILTYTGRSVNLSPLPDGLREDLCWSLDGMFEDPDLSTRWAEFVDAEERIKSLEPILVSLITEARRAAPSRRVRILDAAAGVGSESLWILKNHGDTTRVYSNEIDWTLAGELLRQAKLEGLGDAVRLSMFDWRHLSASSLKDLAFDVILALGNSLTCLLDVDEMKRCLTNFAQVLAPTGRLVIDERNFPKVCDPSKFEQGEQFIPSNVIYCGQIHARVDDAAAVGEGRLRLAYYEPGATIEDEPIGRFTVYPFARDEMVQLLDECGFRVVRAYCDLKECGLDNDMGRQDAWFYTYIAMRNMEADSAGRDGRGVSRSGTSTSESMAWSRRPIGTDS